MKKLFFIVFSIVLTLSVQATELIQYNLRVDGMTCPFCLAASEQALTKLEGVEKIDSNLDAAIISVCGPASLEFDEQELDELFKKKGFTYRSLERLETCSLVDKLEKSPKDELESQEHLHGHDAGHHKGHDHESHSHE